MAELSHEPTKITQALAQDLPTFNFALVGKGECQVCEANPAVRTVAVIEEPSQRFADAEGQAKRQEAKKPEQAADEKVFAPRSRPFLLARRADDFFSSSLGITRRRGLRYSLP